MPSLHSRAAVFRVQRGYCEVVPSTRLCWVVVALDGVLVDVWEGKGGKLTAAEHCGCV